MSLYGKFTKTAMAKALKIVSEGTAFRTEYNEAKKLLEEFAQCYVDGKFLFRFKEENNADIDIRNQRR